MIILEHKIKQILLVLVMLSLHSISITIYAEIPSKLLAQPFSNVFVFGDSLSDNGYQNKTYEKRSDFPVPKSPKPPYYEGRYTNGLVWVEYLSRKLNMNASQVFNYAYGGACVTPNDHIVPNLDKQLEMYFSQNEICDPKALYIISIGGNDFMNHLEKTDEELIDLVIQGIESSIIKLIDHGARFFIVPQMMDLSVNPYSIEMDKKRENDSYSMRLRILVSEFNHNYRIMLGKLTREFPNVKLLTRDFVDLIPITPEVAEEYGFINVSDRCNKNDYWHVEIPICQNPEEYIFWDHIHPTTRVHKILADKIFDLLL